MPYTESNAQTAALPVKQQPADTQQPVQEKPKRRWFKPEKVPAAFWTTASVISLIVNLVLILVLVFLGQQLFALKQIVEQQVLGGLYTNFVKMDEAHIRTTIPVSAEVPAKFDLPLSTNTMVTLTEDTQIPNATIYELNAGALYISRASTNIMLPAGTQLPVALNLTVPVDQKIPVNLMVNVDIPLAETDLHHPFVGLQGVVKPYYTLLDELPDSWEQAVCGSDPSEMCQKLVP